MKPKRKAGWGSQSKKHHFVPEFYLAKWCNKQGNLLRYQVGDRGLEKKWFTPGGTGYRKHLYNLFMTDKFIYSLEESFFGPLDNDANNALRAFIAFEFDNDVKLKWDWSLFIVSLLYRSPRSLQQALVEVDGLMNLPFPFPANEVGPLAKLGAAVEWLEQREGMPPRAFERFHGLSTAMLWERKSKGLEKLIWRIATIGPGLDRLLLSDCPVVSRDRSNNLVHFDMPLTPDLLLTGARNQEEIERSPPPAEHIQLLNRQIVLNAEKFVFARDAAQDDLVAEYLGKGERSS